MALCVLRVWCVACVWRVACWLCDVVLCCVCGVLRVWRCVLVVWRCVVLRVWRVSRGREALCVLRVCGVCL